MKYLKSFHLKSKHTKTIEKEIFKSIYDSVFLPVLQTIKDNLPVENNYDYLKSLITTGKIQYIDGKFYGQWNAKISRALRDIGAKFNYRNNTFELTHLPMEIQMAIGQADNMYKNIVSSIGSIDFQLNPIEDTVYDTTAKELKKDFMASLLGLILLIPSDIKTKKYVDDLNFYLEEFESKEILKLLQFCNTSNNNLTKIYDYIEKRIDLSKRKAKFLAENETNLMINDYKKQEYKTMGITQYKWQTMEDAKVRPRHAELNGKIIDYDNPPIQDEYGNTAHAGEWYNCRCRQIPLLP